MIVLVPSSYYLLFHVVSVCLICPSITCWASTIKVQTGLHIRSPWGPWSPWSPWGQSASTRLNSVYFTVLDDIQEIWIGQPLSYKYQSVWENTDPFVQAIGTVD